jgi:hypothetical protein
MPAPDQGEAEDLIPTVLIVCHSPTEAADALLRVSTKMRIEVCPGSCELFTSNHTLYHEEVNMGASIGVCGCRSSGTLGGYVRDVASGNLYGVTNGHVVAMHLKEALDDLPMLITPESPSVQINQNSDQDHADLLDAAQKVLEQAVTNAEEHGGMNERRNARVLKKQQEYDEINERNCLFGLVHFGAHEVWYRKEEGIYQWKDYALIDAITGKNLCWNHISNGY